MENKFFSIQFTTLSVISYRMADCNISNVFFRRNCFIGIRYLSFWLEKVYYKQVLPLILTALLAG